MSNDLKQTFWSRLKNVRAGLLDSGDTRPIPMAPMVEEDDNAIWFITAEGTDAHKAAETGNDASFMVADAKSALYATVKGRLSVSQDKEKLDELWNPMAAAWFEDGRKDDDIRLIRYTPTEAEIWATDGAAKYLYETAKANLTQETPDGGDHGRIHF